MIKVKKLEDRVCINFYNRSEQVIAEQEAKRLMNDLIDVLHSSGQIKALHNIIYNVLSYDYKHMIIFDGDDSRSFCCALEQLEDYMKLLYAEGRE